MRSRRRIVRPSVCLSSVTFVRPTQAIDISYVDEVCNLQDTKVMAAVTAKTDFMGLSDVIRDCNPGLEFSIPGFGIVEFPIPGSRDPVGIGGL